MMQQRVSALQLDERKLIIGTRSTKHHEEKGCWSLGYQKVLWRQRMFATCIYTVKVADDTTQVSYASWKRPEGKPDERYLSGTDARVSYGGETSAAFQKGTTTFVAGCCLPDTSLDHTSHKSSTFDGSSVNTAIANSKVSLTEIPDSETPDNEVPK